MRVPPHQSIFIKGNVPFECLGRFVTGAFSHFGLQLHRPSPLWWRYHWTPLRSPLEENADNGRSLTRSWCMGNRRTNISLTLSPAGQRGAECDRYWTMGSESACRRDKQGWFPVRMNLIGQCRHPDFQGATNKSRTCRDSSLFESWITICWWILLFVKKHQ